MKILDGKHVSIELLSKLRDEVSMLVTHGIEPKLAVILVGKNDASLAYIRQKQKACDFVDLSWEQFDFNEDVETQELVKAIQDLNDRDDIHGILVQLPLPKHVNSFDVIEAISPKKDVDGFTVQSLGNLFLSKDFEEFAPGTPLGVIRLLEFYDIEIEGKEVCVVGHSNIVGKPLSVMFLNRNATVTNCHIHTKNLAKHTREADILCVGVGKAGLIKGDMVKNGAVVVDIGFNREENGKMCGDVDFESVKDKVSYISPVPGGVGPMTIACLVENTIKSAKIMNDRYISKNIGDVYL